MTTDTRRHQDWDARYYPGISGSSPVLPVLLHCPRDIEHAGSRSPGPAAAVPKVGPRGAT
jgi:hypothetical protein